MKKLLFIAFVVISSVSFISCSEDSEEITSESIVGTWQEKDTESQSIFVFSVDGSGSGEHINLTDGKNTKTHYRFNYTVNYETNRFTIEWEEGAIWSDIINDSFKITDGRILEFWGFKLNKL